MTGALAHILFDGWRGPDETMLEARAQRVIAKVRSRRLPGSELAEVIYLIGLSGKAAGLMTPRTMYSMRCAGRRPERFRLDPLHRIPGQNTGSVPRNNSA